MGWKAVDRSEHPGTPKGVSTPTSSASGIVTEGGDPFFTGLRRRSWAAIEPGPKGETPVAVWGEPKQSMSFLSSLLSVDALHNCCGKNLPWIEWAAVTAFDHTRNDVG